MTEKNEALRLAAVPIFERSIGWQSDATLELRRLAAVEAQRDALLEALWVCMEHNRLHYGDSHNTVIQARAAIESVEGEKT